MNPPIHLNTATQTPLAEFATRICAIILIFPAILSVKLNIPRIAFRTNFTPPRCILTDVLIRRRRGPADTLTFNLRNVRVTRMMQVRSLAN